MSQSLLLKLDEKILKNTDMVLKLLNQTQNKKYSRNAYIQDALKDFNLQMYRAWKKKQLQKESKLIRQESLDILHEFEALPYDYD